MLRLVPRFVGMELIKISLLTVSALSLLFVVAGALLEGAKLGLDPLRLLASAPLLIPPTLPYTLPASMLFAVTFVYSRMSAHSEITALKAGGINATRLIIPALLLALGTTIGLTQLTDRWIPEINLMFARRVLADVKANLCATLKQNSGFINDHFEYEIFVQNVIDDRLIRPIIKHRKRGKLDDYDFILVAEEATLQIEIGDASGLVPRDVVLTIELIKGIATTFRTGQTQQDVRFDRTTEKMPLPPMGKAKEKIENLTFADLKRYSRRQVDDAFRIQLAAAWQSCDYVLGGMLDGVPPTLADQEPKVERTQRRAREYRAELHLRLVQASAIFPFVLMGCPVGILFQRRDFLQTFFVCFLPIITLFYPLVILAFNVYKEGVCDTPWLLWFPTVVLATTALPLLWRVRRY